MTGYNFKGAKAQELKQRMAARRRAQILDEFAAGLEDGLSPSEAAFRAGADRQDGHKLLDQLRRSVGLTQAI